MNKRIFLRYVAQNIAGMIGLSCYILVDTLFVSVALGASGLAALNLSITVFSVVTGIGQLAGIGGGTDFSLRRAEGRDAERSLPTALLCGGALGLFGQLRAKVAGPEGVYVQQLHEAVQRGAALGAGEPALLA